MIFDETLTWGQVEAARQHALQCLAEDPSDRRAHYLLAATCEIAGDLERMVDELGLTGLAIGMDYGDYDFAVHEGYVRDYLAHAPRYHSQPGRFIVSLPKTASSAMAQLFVAFRGLARVRVSKGGFVRARLVPAWLATFARLGGVLHDHFPATPPNRRLLLQTPPTAIVVVIRDPVTATRSLCDHIMAVRQDRFFAREVGLADLEAIRRLPAELAGGAFFQLFFPAVADWLETWLAFAETAGGDLRFGLVRFEQAIDDLHAAVAQVDRFFEPAARILDPRDQAQRASFAREIERIRAAERTTASPHLGRRQVVLGQEEQEMVWRVRQSHPRIGRQYDLSRYMT